MSELLVFDKFDNLLTILSSEDNDACKFWNAPFKETLNQGSTFEFESDATHEDSKYIIGGNQVAFTDKDGYFRLFVIVEPIYIDGKDGPSIRCVCEPSINELDDEIIEDVRPYNTTLQDANMRVLNDTRWQVGITDDLGINSTNHYYITVKEALTGNINTWGAEYRDRIEIKDNKISGRYIDALFRRGEDTGKIWEIDKDIEGMEVQELYYPKTAMYGRGASLQIQDETGEATGGYTRKITFADIEWKKENGDPTDKPLGQEWVGDENALTLFGIPNSNGTMRHKKGIFEKDEQDPLELLKLTWEHLQSVNKPSNTYKMEVTLLGELTGYEHEKVRLGDTTRAINRDFSRPIEVEERVISFEYDISISDNQGVVELGNFYDIYSEDDRINKAVNTVNDRSSVWDNAANNVIVVSDDKIENITPDVPLNVIATGLFKGILVQWDFVDRLYIAKYEVYASKVSGFTPGRPSLVFSGKASMFTLNADVNEQWYFRVRAVNTHGVAGGFSQEVFAQTARIVSDDILFGEDIAEQLRELSKVTDILAQGTVAIEQLKQDTIDKINETATVYTDEEIKAARENIENKLNQEVQDMITTITELQNNLTSEIEKKQDFIFKGTDNPENPEDKALWMNENYNPPVLMQYDETSGVWNKITRDTFQDILGLIGGDQIAEEAIKSANLAKESVRGEHIENNTIGDSKLELGSISEEKMKWSTHLLF